VRSIIVRYPHLLCKLLDHGALQYTIVPGLDLPPQHALACLPLPLSRRDTPSQLPATRTCGSYRLTACALTTPLLAACPSTPEPSAAERRPLVPTGEVSSYLVLQRTFQLYAVRRCPDDADPFSRGDILQSASGAEGSL